MKMATMLLALLALMSTACQNEAQPRDDAPPTRTSAAPAKTPDSAPAKPKTPDDSQKDACKAIEGVADVGSTMVCLDVFQGGERELKVLKTQADLDALHAKHGERCETKPTFDFEKVTILGTVVSGTCSVKADAKVCEAASGPALSVNVTEEGDCERMAVQAIWMTVPRLAEGQTASLSIKNKP